MKNPTFAALALCLPAAITAVETELRTGPNELTAGAELVSQQVEHGAVRCEDVTDRAYLHARYAGFGGSAQGFFAVGDDDRRDIDTLECSQVCLRADFLWEEQDLFQILPHYQAVFFPYAGADVAHWVGIDAWYLLPMAQGVEIGASFDVDAGGEYGWFSSFGSRQILQSKADNLDVIFWEVANFGARKYHRNYVSGVDNSGFTTLDLGTVVTMPMPWEGFWITARFEVQWWMDGDDRRNLEDSAEIIMGVGGEYRL